MKKDLTSLVNILSVDELNELNKLIRTDGSPDKIGRYFSKKYPGIYSNVIEYIEQYTSRCCLDTGFGNKTEPYYKKESDMIIPKYTYKGLSKEEKEIYNGESK